ncbi:Glycosyltransferase [hydrothermal vent metagenome]|uniref:Glycosyltransferase n=1 Tax=hydrothermal vent metagenome TaxID=652676 RepID=A0A1W1C332_9ZZZZ
MRKIILITYTFPYSNKEQFLETEIQYWQKKENIQLVIMPTVKNSNQREIPKNIFIDNLLSNTFKSISIKILFMFKSLFSSLFYKELRTQVLKNPKAIIRSLYSHAKYLCFKKELEKFLKKHRNENIIFYTYWYTEITYALQSLKSKYHFKLITRVHGTDLYEERKPHQYMPFRKQFLYKIDKIFTISYKANKYLVDTYGFNKKLIKTSRLGVNDSKIITSQNSSNRYHIVSCSNLIKLKQIDKLINALTNLSHSINKNIQIHWTHIGSGILDAQMKQYAKIRLSNLSNVSYTFLGELSNKDVYKFYFNNKVDVFINVSSSEGVPVTIMEAMSCSIPIIAPNIGGIQEMVINEFNGILLNSQPNVNDISNALGRIDLFKSDIYRSNAYKIYKEKYNAQVNYLEFIEYISKL